ncbi:MAG: prepilin-type N-terminal cleavage/methylation domain-containing protein [Mycobacteriales bacterium]
MRKSIEEKDEGFTLIELLVVIIIIGILAAIAIPVFLNQRKKGWDAAAKSDLRNAATAQETWLTDNGVYSSSMGVAGSPGTLLFSVGFKQSATTTSITVVSTRDTVGTVMVSPAQGSGSYCLKAVSKSGTSYWYDSANSGFETVACT